MFVCSRVSRNATSLRRNRRGRLRHLLIQSSDLSCTSEAEAAFRPSTHGCSIALLRSVSCFGVFRHSPLHKKLIVKQKFTLIAGVLRHRPFVVKRQVLPLSAQPPQQQQQRSAPPASFQPQLADVEVRNVRNTALNTMKAMHIRSSRALGIDPKSKNASEETKSVRIKFLRPTAAHVCSAHFSHKIALFAQLPVREKQQH